MPILPVLKDFKKHPRKLGMLVHADNPITHLGSSWATNGSRFVIKTNEQNIVGQIKDTTRFNNEALI